MATVSRMAVEVDEAACAAGSAEGEGSVQRQLPAWLQSGAALVIGRGALHWRAGRLPPPALLGQWPLPPRS